MKQGMVGVMVIILFISLCIPCFAEEYKEETQKKFSRGLANVLSAFGEIPKTIVEETKDVEVPIYEPIEGLFKGVGKTLVRLISGVYDLVVAPIPNIKTFPPDPEFLDISQQKEEK